MQGIGIVALAANVRIGAALEQKSNSRFAFSKNGVMQSGSYTWSGGFVDQSRIGGEQGVESREIAAAAASCKDRIVASMDGLVCRESK